MRNLLVHIGHILLLIACGGLLACASGGTALNAQRIQDIERDNEELRQSVEAVRASLEQLKTSLSALERNADELMHYIEMPGRIRQGAERISEKLQSIEGKLQALERQDPRAVRVKVLSGDGDPESALLVADVLREKGYEVGDVGVAPSEGFEAHAVFFAEGFADAARAIAREIGHGTNSMIGIRPLTWSSVYDVIVVTGGKD